MNKDLSVLRQHFKALHERFQFHVCGEGGEYESLVLDCPLFKKRLVLDETEIVFPDGDESNSIDEVGLLNILKCHAEEKDIGSVPLNSFDRPFCQTDSIIHHILVKNLIRQ